MVRWVCRWLQVLGVSALLALPAVGQSPATGYQASEMTLADALAAALSRYPQPTAPDLSGAGDPDGLLAALPVFSATHAQSDLGNRGTDETELFFTLPLKSGQRRALDSDLRRLETRFEAATSAYRAWFFSGIIREAVWSHRLAEVQAEEARQQVQLLADLQQRMRLQVEAGTVPEYAALLVEQERLDARGRLIDFESAAREAARHFRVLSGLPLVPATIAENAPSTAPDYAAHPRLVSLLLGREQSEALIGLSEPGAANWSLALMARDFAGPGPDERQYGVSMEIPLSLFRVSTRANRSQREAARREYSLQRDQVLLDIRQGWESLLTTRERLQAQRDLLVSSVALGERIEAQLMSLRTSNEVEAELVLRRLIEILDRRAQLAVAEVELGRNAARQRQMAGLPL
jgi:outer membrane protein TolC